MKTELLQILQHSLGVDQYGHGRQYRNHFYADGKDISLCKELEAMGFMWSEKPSPLTGGSIPFFVTEEGKKAMADNSPKPPKLNRSKQRYQQYREYGDSFDSFLDFVRWNSEPERPWNDGYNN